MKMSKTRTVEEIKKAIEARKRQNEADAIALKEAEERETEAATKENIFIYLDGVRKAPPENVKNIISEGCEKYNDGLVTLRAKFRDDLQKLKDSCVETCFGEYKKTKAGAVIADFLKHLEDIFPEIKKEIDAEKAKTKAEAEAKKAKAKAEAEAKRAEAEAKRAKSVTESVAPSEG